METANTVVGIFGTVHQQEMREMFNLSFERMRSVILAFKPDVICGEVRPEDWEKHVQDSQYAGYLGPSEYRGAILPLCEEQNIEFVPVDWFEMDLVHLNSFEGLGEAEAAEAGRVLAQHYDGIFEAALRSPLPGNSFEVDERVQEKMDFLQRIDPVSFNITTLCRNQIMIERIKAAIAKHPGKRILCIAGFEHNVFYYKGLKAQSWELEYPL